MDFSFSADQEMIRDTAADFLAEAASSAAVRAAMETDTGFDSAVWTQVAQELGWCATPIPEAYDGIGLGNVELVLLMEQMGRRLLPSPFFATVALATQVLLEVADETSKRQYLPKIAAGELTATVALATQGMDWQPAGINAAIGSNAQGTQVINGQFAMVADGATADVLIVPAADENGLIALFALAADLPGITRTPLKNFDLTRRLASVQLNDVVLPVGAEIANAAQVAAFMPRAISRARLALAAEQLGGAQQCLDLVLAYTAERVQFGRTIASFQAIKHRCAQMMVQIEAARSAIYGAAAVADNPALATELLMEAAAAKALISDTYCHCAGEAIQLHGGVGFTWEYDPQLYFKRAQASAHWLGSSDALREGIASVLLDAA